MKKLLSFVFVAFMFVACGSETPDTVDSGNPGAVFKKYLSAYFQGEVQETTKYVYFKSEDEKNAWIEEFDQYARLVKKGAAALGGIKSIETFILKESNNKAKVICVITFGSKHVMSANECKTNFTKIDDTWYLDKPFR